MSMQSTTQIETLPFQQARAEELLQQIGEITNSDRPTERQYDLQEQLGAATDEQAAMLHETAATVSELRDKVANVDDFFRPIRNYFYWEPQLLRHSAVPRLSVRSSTRWTGSTPSPTSSPPCPWHWTS